MAVKIRLKRVGMRNTAVHRIVVADGRKPRDGTNIEELGTYWPLQEGPENFKLNLDRAEYWLGVGAQPSDTVRSIIRKARRVAKGLELPVEKPKKKKPAKDEASTEEAATEEAPAEAVQEEAKAEAPAEEPEAEEAPTEEPKAEEAPVEDVAENGASAEEGSEGEAKDKPAE